MDFVLLLLFVIFGCFQVATAVDSSPKERNFVQDDHTFMSGYLYGPPPQHQRPRNALPGSFPTEQNCSVFEQTQVKKCAQPLYEIGIFRSDSTFSFTWQYFVSRTKDYFSQVCDKFLIFDMCIESYKPSCFTQEPMKGRYQTAIKVLDFLCRDGYSEMMKNFECFTKTLTRAEMMQCQAEMVGDTRKIPTGNGLAEYSEAKDSVVCGAMRNYMECIKYPIRYECGYRAWYIVREMLIRPTVMVLPECELTSAASRSFSPFLLMLPAALWSFVW